MEMNQLHRYLQRVLPIINMKNNENERGRIIEYVLIETYTSRARHFCLKLART